MRVDGHETAVRLFVDGDEVEDIEIPEANKHFIPDRWFDAFTKWVSGRPEMKVVHLVDNGPHIVEIWIGEPPQDRVGLYLEEQIQIMVREEDGEQT